MYDLALHADFLYGCSNFHFALVLAALDSRSAMRFLAILLVPVNDPAAREVIRRKLDRDAIPGQNADEILAHFAGDVGQHLMLVLELDAKHRVRKGLNDGCHHFNGVFFTAALARFFFLLLWPTIHALLALPVLLFLAY
jgi:hypothetical protein